VALRFLAGGAPMDIVDIHGVCESTFYLHLHPTLTAIDAVLEWPGQLHEDTAYWGKISEGFAAFSRGALHGCIGAIDGIAIRLQKPKGVPDAERYFSRKGHCALNVQATCDAMCRFTWCCPNFCGHMHDSTACECTQLHHSLERHQREGATLEDRSRNQG